MYVIDNPARPWSAAQSTEYIVLKSLFLYTGMVSISYLYSEASTHWYLSKNKKIDINYT